MKIRPFQYVLLLLISLMITSYTTYKFLYNSPDFSNLFQMTGIVLLIIFLVLMIQKYWDTEQRYTRQQFLIDQFKRVLQDFSSIGTVKDLENNVLRPIRDILFVQGIAIQLDRQSESLVISAGDSMDDSLGSRAKVITIYQRENDQALLLVSEKKNGFPFSPAEERSLEWLAQYFAVALENLELIEKLSGRLQEFLVQPANNKQWDDYHWLRKSMLQIQEADRQRIAGDIHDSALQDIYFLKQMLELNVIKSSSLKEREWLLRDAIERLEMIQLSLRQSCYELYPHVLEEYGLLSAIHHFLSLYAKHAEFKTKIIIEQSFVPIVERIPIEIKQQLYRLFVEWWNNTKKHADASNVTFRFLDDNQRILIVYEDDGVGFKVQSADREAQADPSNGGGIGLIQMKSRLIQIHAEWSVFSEPGRGVRYEVYIAKNK